LPIDPHFVEIIEITIKEQIKLLKVTPVKFERTEKTPNKVTNFRDFQLGEYLGYMKQKHIFYLEKQLNHELNTKEFDELDIIFSRYHDDIADIYYNY